MSISYFNCRVFILVGITILFCLFICEQSIFAQYNNVPQYAKVASGWQWNSSSDGTTYIPVCWENPQGYSTETSWVKSAIALSWENAANVSFRWEQQCSSNSNGVRIRIADTRSRTLGVGKALDGVKNGMELNFTFNVKDEDGDYMFSNCRAASKKEACIKALANHEFGHALGFKDEDNDVCQHVTGRGFARPDSDAYSIMNYCNEEWNGGGKLSLIDIRDIQNLYGKKIVKSESTSQGLFTISDSLEPKLNQVWENVVIDFGGTRQFFNLNAFATTQTRAWNFPSAGSYCYNVWTYTMHINGNAALGYGQGCVPLEKGGTYTFRLVILGIAPQGYLILKIENTSNVKEVF